MTLPVVSVVAHLRKRHRGAQHVPGELLSALGAESRPMTSGQFALHLRAEIARFARAIKDSGATAQ